MLFALLQYEAGWCLVKALVDGQMLTSREEEELQDSLEFREEDRWLHLLYRSS